MTTNETYRPIDCDQHSRYELAVMRGQRLELRWSDSEGRERLAVMLPVDVVTENGAEYLLACDNARQLHRLRLDHILAAEPAR